MKNPAPLRSLAGLAFALALAAACVGKTTDASEIARACERLSAAGRPSRCGGLEYTSDEVAHLSALSTRVCEDRAALAGSSWNVPQIDACAKAYDTETCDAYFDDSACRPRPGTRPTGASCFESTQCASGLCAGIWKTDLTPPRRGCGTCAATRASGQACDPATFDCGPGTTCRGESGAATCVPITTVDLGAPCDQTGAFCRPALHCSNVSHTCIEPLDEGAACPDGEGCKRSLGCVAGTCVRPKNLGEPCAPPAGCASGLGCDPATKTCVKHVVVRAGEACDAIRLCFVGDCTPAGTCQEVIADGQRCDASDRTKTCDLFSMCIDGSCAFVSGEACR